MPETFTLSIAGGEPQTLAALGVDMKASPMLTTGGIWATAKGRDSLEFVCPARIESTPLVTYGQRVELFDGDGTRRFVGWAMTPRPEATPEGERIRYVFEDVTRFLKSTFKQYMYFPSGDGLAGEQITKVVLFRNVDLADGVVELASIAFDTQIAGLLTWAKTYGNAGGAAPFDFDITGIPTGLHMPETQKESASVLECLDTCMRFMPGLMMRVKYDGTAGSNPKICFVNMTTLDDSGPVSPPTLAGYDSPVTHTWPNDGSLFTKISADPNDSGLLGKVEIFWVYADSSSGTDMQWLWTSETSTVDNGSPAVLSLTLQTRSCIWNGSKWILPESISDILASKISRQLHMAQDRPWWTFGATFRDGSYHWEVRPGDLACISSAGTALAGAYAIIQGVKRNLATGEVHVQTGAPSTRGAGELLARVLDRHSDYGFKPNDTEQGAGQPSTPKELTVTIANLPGDPGVNIKAGKIGGWFAAATMDPLEDGTVARPYYRLGGLADGDFLWVVGTISWDGVAWSITSTDIGHGAVVPTADATHFYYSFASVSVTDGAVTAVGQTQWGPVAWVRPAFATATGDDFRAGA